MMLSALTEQTIGWLVLVVVLVLVELATTGLFTIWFAAGAVAAALLSAYDGSFLLQVSVFLIVSAVLLGFTRPLAGKVTGRTKIRTNVDRYLGQKAIVTEEVNNLNQTGRIKVLGQDWSARTEHDTDILQPGAVAEVVRISGAKLIVKKTEE